MASYVMLMWTTCCVRRGGDLYCFLWELLFFFLMLNNLCVCVCVRAYVLSCELNKYVACLWWFTNAVKATYHNLVSTSI